MANENKRFPDISVIWPNWKITEIIGRGSFGTVYKAVHETAVVAGDAAAIKVISIPNEDSETENRKLDGASEDEIRKEYEEIRDEYVNEIKFMMDFRDTPNVVRIEDYEVVPKKDSIGWIIYIRMELLTDLRVWANEHGINAHDVIRIGKDICRALITCEKRHLLHRDIKQSNIMVNTTTNTFKLSDFGIAKYNNALNWSLSFKGTPDYMAPEVCQFSEYDSRIDIYSLGMVLYYYMNKKRGPFLVLDRLPTANERENANQRRYQGEPLPAPAEAAPALSEVILHACAYDPNDRFQSAKEFYDALCQVEAGTYKVGTYVASNTNLQVENKLPQDDYDSGTVMVRRAPGSSVPEMSQAPVFVPAQPVSNVQKPITEMKKKRSSLPVVIIVILLLISAACAVAVYLLQNHKPIKENNSERITEESESTTITTTTATTTTTVTQPETTSQATTAESTYETSGSAPLVNKFYAFPGWYELDKTVVKNNMIAETRSDYWWENADGTKNPYIWLYVFDKDGHAICEYSWLCCSNEANAKAMYNTIMGYSSDEEKKDVYLDGKYIAFNKRYAELDTILKVAGYSSYDQITMKDVIRYLDGSLWGKEPSGEIVYK
ncbi:MAG: serine/threonine protein kinase [Ruminococcaceae bacterium]|nr:serine/threonine protein kinase [Oscillospiraceae bacterium]